MDTEIKTRIEMINKGEVPEGYKETKVGIIPEDWEVKRLGEIAKFLDDKRVPIKEEDRRYMEKLYPYYGASGVIDYVDDYLFDEELILLGEDGANILTRSSRLAFLVSGKYWVNNHAHVMKGKECINQYFLAEKLESLSYKKYNTGTAQPKINQKTCSNIEIAIPFLQEQQKIAQILSTWDEAIELKEKLIEENKEQKKGLMQKLLTGEVRLPGFDGEWEEVRLGDVGEIVTGTTPSTKMKEYYESGIYPWITPTDITENKYISESERYLTDKGLKVGRFLPAGSLLVTCIASIGKNAILTTNGSCNQQINAILPSENYSNEFLYYLISYRVDHIKSYAGTSATQIINKSTFESLKFLIPPLQEQKAIAQILTTADQEIDLLTQELEQLKLQKKGLMQLLLTGIVRVKC